MIKELLQEGFILKTRGYYKYAIEAFYKALEFDNTSSELLLEIADTYYLMGEEERAISYIEQVLDKDPAHAESLKLLKKIFTDKKAWEEAEQTAKNIYCITNQIEDLAAIFELLNKQNRFNEIFEYETDKISPEILYQKAFAKFYLNELDEAEKLINEALNFVQKREYLLLKCKILFKMNRKEKCVELIENIKEEAPSADFLNFAGLIKQYQGKFKQAIDCFTEAIKLAPSEDEYYYNCASTYFKADNIRLAKKYYNLAISLNPDNQNYHFALANLHYSQKHYKRALEELTGDFFEARLLKSIILYDSGYLALARIEFESLAKERPEDPIVKDYKSRIENELRI